MRGYAAAGHALEEAIRRIRADWIASSEWGSQKVFRGASTLYRCCANRL
jgi:hypothetical protein